ncbi:MAG: hypothetical protein HY519_02785 [Candidatus Aenigmarchaeota archaeon]|nr:hypothetical protein [Candidatus Aenigmarchaeota archaeon]
MQNETSQGRDAAYRAVFALVLVAIGVAAFNQYQIAAVTANVAAGYRSGATVPDSAAAPTGSASADGVVQEAIRQVIPTGIPEVYGSELGVSFDKPVESLSILSQYDDLTDAKGRGSKPISLSASLQQRYVKVGSSIACEYCCGAKTLVFSDGRPACGCEHSGAMRGLAKYLLEKHPDLTDQQILGELAKWKALFFPQQSVAKYIQLQAQAGKVDQSTLGQLPGMVGGC